MSHQNRRACSLTFRVLWGHNKKASVCLFESSHQNPATRTLILDFQRSELWEVNSVLKATHVCMLSHVSHVQLLAHQAPLSIGFSRQEYWSGLLLPSPLPPKKQRSWRNQKNRNEKKNYSTHSIEAMQIKRMNSFPALQPINSKRFCLVLELLWRR